MSRPVPIVRPGRSVVAAAFAVDVVLVIAFAALGRATHDDGEVLGPGGAGLARTAWPFLVALTAGWAVARAWRRPLAPLRSGAPIWAVTVVGGLLLRVVSGEGAALAFVIVATLTLALLLVGWRAVAMAAAAISARRAREGPPLPG